MTLSLFDRPAVLFLPASRPGAIDKARQSAADLVILDLEDAVKPEDKEAARTAAIAAVAGDWSMPVAIRVNGSGTRWHQEDVEAVADSRAALAVLPSVHSADEVSAVKRKLGKPLAAMIETPGAVIDSPFIARAGDALIVGTNDLAAGLRLPAGAGRAPMMHALQGAVLAARAAGIPVFDGVFNRLDDAEGFAAEAAESRILGFDGKTLIHPDQIAPCHAAFAPTAAELDRARRLVDAARGGAERFEGAMVEAMHVDAARRLLERGQR